MMQTSDSALGLVKGKPTERWRRKVSGLRSLGLYDSGTAESSPSTGLYRRMLFVRHGNGWRENRSCSRTIRMR